MGRVANFQPCTVFILLLSAIAYISAISLDGHQSHEPADHRGTVADDAQHVLSVPRGGSQKAICGNGTTISVIEAGYAETAASVSKLPSYTLPSCKKNSTLAKSLDGKCNEHETSCLMEAPNSMNAPAGCRWKFLVVTYKCIEMDEEVGMSMAGGGAMMDDTDGLTF